MKFVCHKVVVVAVAVFVVVVIVVTAAAVVVLRTFFKFSSEQILLTLNKTYIIYLINNIRHSIPVFTISAHFRVGKFAYFAHSSLVAKYI